MEEENIKKHKPHTFFNRRLSIVIKKTRGNMTTDKKNKIKKLFNRGNMTKGNMAMGITVIMKSYYN